MLPNEVDSLAEFGEVLAVSRDGELTVGAPVVPGAMVRAQVKSHYKDRKLMVYKYIGQDEVPQEARGTGSPTLA